MIIRPYQSGDLIHIKSIVKKLHPQWFDENALKNIPIDAQLGKTYIAEENSEIRGFIIISSLEGTVWINWIGVDPQYHGISIGTQLLEHTEKKLRELGVKKIRVDTVVEQSPADGTYDKTLQFYLKNRFKLIEKKEQQKFKEFTFRRGVLLKML